MTKMKIETPKVEEDKKVGAAAGCLSVVGGLIGLSLFIYAIYVMLQ